MRILGAILAWVVIVGGVQWYLHGRTPPAPPLAFESKKAKGVFALEITPSFGVAPNPFALNLDEEEAPPALVVKLSGKEILRETRELAAGQPITLSPVEGVVYGRNEFFVQANPPQDAINRANAVRVRVLLDGRPIEGAVHTLWSEPGTAVAATFMLDVPEPAHLNEDDGHGH